MSEKFKKCPICDDGGKVDDNMFCSNCGNQLAYIDSKGTIIPESNTISCIRCHTENSNKNTYCESCGTSLTQDCPLCKGKHRIDAVVCAKYGEPLKTPEKKIIGIMPVIRSSFGLLLTRYRKTLAIPAIFVILAFGIFSGLNKHTLQPIAHNGPSIDVVFTVDTTGSMLDEIQVVQKKIREMMSSIRSGQPVPFVRFGLVAYRDRGDDYIAKKFDLTDDIQKFQSYVDTLSADGGGDTKESVNEALDTAINNMAWDNRQSTKKLIFLIGDAGPHTDYNNNLTYYNEAINARKNGIKIYTIGCSGIEEDGLNEYKEIAQATGGTFDYLTYREEFRDKSGATFYRLKAGEKYYSTDSRSDEWKDGAGTAEKKGIAKEINPSSHAIYCSTSSGGPGRSIMLESSAKPSSIENNLDMVLTKTVKEEAESMGIKYK